MHNDELRTADGKKVVDPRRVYSQLDPHTKNVCKNAISQVDSKGRLFIREEVEYDGIIGKTICVSTGPTDCIIFAQRVGKAGLTRFVLDRTPEWCSSVMVLLKRSQEDPQIYVLINCYIGTSAEPEPWDRNATAASLEFWLNKALIWGEEPTIQGTATTTYPSGDLGWSNRF